MHTQSKKSSRFPRTYRLSPKTGSRGVTILLVIAFMGVFGLVVDTITGYVFQQSRYGRALYAREQALHIAEAGLEYYKWFLAHNPSIMTAGAGLVSPYTYVVEDPEGGTEGNSAVTATANLQCGVPQWIDLSAKGTADANPLFPRTVNVRYMRPSVAEYASVINANVWFSSVSSGPVHSNGAIRMDGANDADVTSPVSTYYCDGQSTSLGCNGVSPNPSAGWKNGVFGLGSGSALWRWGETVPNVSFANMALNYGTLKGYAQTSGVYLPYTWQGNTVGGSDQSGYHVRFNSNGTIDVWRVTSTVGVWSQHVDNLTSPATWITDYHIINNEVQILDDQAIPSGCSIIYSEAKTWIEGTVAGKVTIVAADTGSFTPDIVLSGDITYLSTTGSTGLTAVAERSVLIPLNSPDIMNIRGIFVAVTGYFGRNYYTNSGTKKVPTSPVDYSPYVTQSTLNRFGTTVSTLRPATKWTSGGVFISGYNSGSSSYDRVLAFSPPPFTPTVSTDYKFSLWREQ